MGHSCCLKLLKEVAPIKALYQIGPYSFFPEVEAGYPLPERVSLAVFDNTALGLGESIKNYAEVRQVYETLLKLREPIRLLEYLLGQNFRQEVMMLVKSTPWSEYRLALGVEEGEKAVVDVWALLGTVLSQAIVHQQKRLALLEGKLAETLIEQIAGEPDKARFVSEATHWLQQEMSEPDEALLEAWGITAELVWGRVHVDVMEGCPRGATDAFFHRVSKGIEGTRFTPEEESLWDHEVAYWAKKPAEAFVSSAKAATKAFTDKGAMVQVARWMAIELLAAITAPKMAEVLLLLENSVRPKGGEIKDFKATFEEAFSPFSKGGGHFQGKDSFYRASYEVALEGVFKNLLVCFVYRALPETNKASRVKKILGFA